MPTAAAAARAAARGPGVAVSVGPMAVGAGAGSVREPAGLVQWALVCLALTIVLRCFGVGKAVFVHFAHSALSRFLGLSVAPDELRR